jgi:hypothetical protein
MPPKLLVMFTDPSFAKKACDRSPKFTPAAPFPVMLFTVGPTKSVRNTAPFCTRTGLNALPDGAFPADV